MSESTSELPEDATLEQLLYRVSEELSDADPDTGPSERTRRIASTVHDVVSTRETAEIVDAAGIDRSESDGPASLLAAIQHGDQESVAKLRTLLLLSKLDSTEDEADAKSVLEDLKSVSQQYAVPDPESTPAEDSGSDRAEETQQATEPEDEAEGDSDIKPQLESELREATENLRENIEGYRNQLRDQQTEDDTDADIEETEAEATGAEDVDEADETDDVDEAEDESKLKSELSDPVDSLQDRFPGDPGESDDADEEREDAGGRSLRRRNRFSQGRFSTVPSRGPPKMSHFSTVRGTSNDD